jgi:hypothetical protein
MNNLLNLVKHAPRFHMLGALATKGTTVSVARLSDGDDYGVYFGGGAFRNEFGTPLAFRGSKDAVDYYLNDLQGDAK